VALVVVDAENVRRSRWPNLSREQLVERTRAWAEREGHELVVVFDGEPPEDAPDLVGSPYADDEIAALVDAAGGAVWVATSDRELRRRVEGRAERIIGGGTFVHAI
jgi:predicted RNA-binding protein with PIN domain